MSLHFNKGLAGAPAEAIAAAKETAIQPAALDAFALAITASSQGSMFLKVISSIPIGSGPIGAQTIRGF